MKIMFFEASVFMPKMDFLKFYDVNTSDNLPFQPYFCNPHVISFQKMHILSVVQFMPKKCLPPDCGNFCKANANMPFSQNLFPEGGPCVT